MNSKIIKKLLDYAQEHEIFDLAITRKNGHHVLWGETGLTKHELKLPAKLEAELSMAFRHLLSLADSELVNDAYFKTKDSAFKLSIIPDSDGEKIIINTVDKARKLMALSRLGLGRDERRTIEKFLHKQKGLVVVGSADNQGKTTTLYSLLDRIDREKRSSYSLEEYSEISIDGVNAVISSKEQRLIDLARIMKSDSEVIMIDDVNDALLKESVAAARSGRLVLVGIKADSVSSIVEKVISINKKEDLPILIVFQKLLMKNCPKCLKAYVIGESEELIEKYWPEEKKYKPRHFFETVGCPSCQHSGIKGKIAAFNLINIREGKADIISSLSSDVLQKASNGLISIKRFISQHRNSLANKL